MFDTSNVLAWLQSPTTNGLFSPGFGGFSNGLSLSSYFNTPVANQSAPNSTNLNQNQNEHDMVPPQTPSLRNIMSIPLDVMSSASGAGITRCGGGGGHTAVLLKQRHSLPTVTNATTATAITTTVPNTPNNVITSTTTSFFFSDVANLNSQQQRQQNQLSPPSCGEDEAFTYTPSGRRGHDDDPDDEDENGRTSRYHYNHVSTISEDRGSSSHNSTGAIGESPTVVHSRHRHGANNPSHHNNNNNIICISPLAILNNQQNKKKNYYNYNNDHDDHIPTPTMDFKEIFASPNEQQRLVQHRRYTYPTNKARASTTGTMVEDNNDDNKKSSLHHNDDDEEDEDLNVLLQFTVHHHGTPCRTSAMLDVFRSPPTTTKLRTTGNHRNRTIDATSSRHNNNDDDMNELPQPQEHDHGDDDDGNRLPALHLPLIRNGSKNRMMNPLPVLHQRLTQKHTNKSTNVTNQNDFVPPESDGLGGGKNIEGNTNSSMTYHHPLLYPSTSSLTTDHVHPHHLHPGSHYYSIPPPPGSSSTAGSMRITVGGSGNSKDSKPPYPDYYHHMHAAAAAQHHVMHPGYPPPPHHHHHLYGPYVGYPIYNPLPGTTPGTASSTTYPPQPYGTTSKSTKSTSYKRPLSNNNNTKDSGKGGKTQKASSHADNDNEKSTTGSNKRPALLSTPSSAALGNVNNVGQESNKKLKKSANGPSIGGSTTTNTAGLSNSKKKKASSASCVGSTPVDRQKTLDTIQNLNAAAGGKNDKAAALAAAILRGVTMRPSGKWQAQLYYAGKSRYIGVFDTREKAALAYEIAREKLKSGSAGVGVGGTTGIGSRPAAASSTLGVESSKLSAPTPTTVQSSVGSTDDNKGSSNSAVKSSGSVSCTESLVNLARKAAFDGVNESFSDKP